MYQAARELLTEDVDHGLVQHLEQRQKVENQKPEYGNRDLVLGFIVHDLGYRD